MNALAADLDDKKGEAATFLNAIALPIEIAFAPGLKISIFSVARRRKRHRNSAAQLDKPFGYAGFIAQQASAIQKENFWQSFEKR
jgi:hypothetical protein